MALVTVLLMITVFSILGIAVISLSISNTKQASKSEQDMQAVDLAEMGVIYYKNAFIPHANEKLRLAIQTAIANIQNEESNGKGNGNGNGNKQTADDSQNPTIILEHLSIESKDLLPIISSEAIPVDRIENTAYSFKINYHIPVSDNNPENFQIEFESIGKSIDATASITGTITLNKAKLIEAYLNTGGTGKIITKDMTIEKPILLSRKYDENLGFEGNDISDGYSYTIEKIPNYQFDIINKIAIVNGIFEQNKGNRKIKNSFLYITNGASFGNSQQSSIQGLTLFVGGDTFFHNAKAGIKDSLFYIDGDLTFHNQVGTISNSKLCVSGDINSKKNNFPSPDEEWNEGAYSCMLFKNISNTPGSNLLETIADQVNNMNLKYE